MKPWFILARFLSWPPLHDTPLLSVSLLETGDVAASESSDWNDPKVPFARLARVIAGCLENAKMAVSN